MRNIFWIFLFLYLINPSCTIQKRTVNKGYYVQWYWNNFKSEKKNDLTIIHPQKIEYAASDTLKIENESTNIEELTFIENKIFENEHTTNENYEETKPSLEKSEISKQVKIKTSKINENGKEVKPKRPKTLIFIIFLSLFLCIIFVLLGILMSNPNLIFIGIYISFAFIGAIIVFIRNKFNLMDREKRLIFQIKKILLFAILFLIGTIISTLLIFEIFEVGIIFLILAIIFFVLSLVFTVYAIYYHKRLKMEFPKTTPKKQLALKNKFRIRLVLTFIFLISFFVLLSSVTLSQYAIIILLLKVFTYTSLAVTLAPLLSFIFLFISLVLCFLSGFSARKNFLYANGKAKPKEAEKKNKVFKGFRLLMIFSINMFLLALIFVILASTSTYYGLALSFSAVLFLIVGVILLVGALNLKQRMKEQ